MDKILEKIRSSIEKPMQDMNIIITNIEFVEEGTYKFLRIELDKASGLDLDTIVDATNVINPIIDELDLIDESYILDIISKEKGDA